ncbi:alpha/beta hydrolase [Paenibacillus bovis]|uniref:Esterase n=1 Tax=Paenibacillus bovis TaxID=1616788 RepID=A0A172ZCT9_9BACL|nr:alpha/beta hydrolase [Paenibacillus bovis]ANF94970.1 esterase [Paenibacillus bovis]
MEEQQKAQQLEMIRQIRQQQFTQVDGGTLTPPGTPAAQRSEITIPTSYGEARTHVYVPLDARESAPVFINLHGGGFVMGTPEMDDPWCAYVADLSGCIVFNVDYVLAPEHKFPSTVYQCYEVAQWVKNHASEWGGDGSRLAIGGHSAGGNLSAAVCLLNQQKGGELPIAYQILDYPPLDLDTDPANKPDFEEAIPVDIARMFNAMYFENMQDARNPLASPVLASSSELVGLPPALVITAGRDSLAAEAVQYAQMLQKAGVPVVHREYPGEAHGFTHNGTSANAEEAWQLMAEQLKQTFSIA